MGIRSGARRALPFVLALSIVAAACGDDDDDDSSGAASTTAGVTSPSGTDTTGGGATGDAVAQAVQFVADASEAVTAWDPPPAHATPPASGKKIFVVSIDQRLEGAVRAVDGLDAAAEILGWTTTLVDGQSDPNAMADGVQRAVREKADGVVLVYINSQQIPAAVTAARQASIPVVSILSGNEPSDTGVSDDIGGTDETHALGLAQGNYVVAKSEGTAKVILFVDPSFTLNQAIADGFKEALGACSGCSIVEEVTFTGADVVTKLPQLASTAATRSADADWAVAPYDAAATSISQGFRDAGKSDIKLVGTGGNLPNLKEIGDGGTQVASVGQALEWTAFTAMDNVARLIAAEDVVPLSVPLKILDASNLPPAGTAWTGDFDYSAMYTELWKG